MTDLAPDLDPMKIQRAISPKRIGRRVVVRPVVSSTMDALGSLAHAGEPEGTVLITDRQMSGRGRMGRSWLAPPGTSLLLSILYRPSIEPERMSQVMMATALGLLDVLDVVVPATSPAALKWPNDVLAGELKIAGLLAEGRLASDRAAAVVVGLGLNVTQLEGMLPPGATSLAALGVAPPPRDELCASLLTAIDARYDALLAGVDLVRAWSDRLRTLGRRVVATGGGDEVKGKAVGVTPDGGLRIMTGSGAVVTVHAGDVTLDTVP
jgi:BirA family biotin operon repressor/biotin-[acetyl-CoA-carboxylase] ligase